MKRTSILKTLLIVPAWIFALLSLTLSAGETNAGETQAATQLTPASPELAAIKLPAGFHMGVFAADLDNARSLCQSPKGTVFVGSRTAGKIYALVDKDNDGVAENRFTLLSGLNMPNGVAFHAGSLYVAERTRILRFDEIESHLSSPPKPVVVYDKLPSESEHGWRYIGIGPDQKIYVTVGAPCNICLRPEPVFAAILRLDLDGKNLEVYAHGVRNSVGLDWHPQTGHLWFTDNGRDMLGDDIPPDELNVASKVGQHFGYPFCHGGFLADPQFGSPQKPCSQFVAPVQNLGAHVAAIGMRFYTGTMFPPSYRQQIFIAEHGSWNRSSPVGYRLTLVTLQGEKALSYETFAEGWLDAAGKVSGRPVDLLVRPDGSLLVSDDYANKVYRIFYGL